MSDTNVAAQRVIANLRTLVPPENAILLRFVDWKPGSIREGLGDQSQKP